MIFKRMNKEGDEVCPNSSSFYKTKYGIEYSLRRKKGNLRFVIGKRIEMVDTDGF